MRAGEVHRGNPAQASSVIGRRPSWLRDGPLTDRVRLIGCRRCRRPVLEALVEGLWAERVDLIRLTPLAELEHLVHGGQTRKLWPDRPGAIDLHLAFRTQWDIPVHPGRGLPLHDCAISHGPPDPTILASHQAATLPEEPPF